MEPRGGDTVVFRLGEEMKRWRISKIDGNVVKIFEENGAYRQMAYTDFMKLLEKVQYTLERPDLF